MRLFVTRHSQTEWNVQRKICGHTDIDLTDEGINQAKKLGLHIQEHALNIDLIISSPLHRAIQTAELLNEYCHADFLIDKRLIEQCYGIYEGKDWEDVGFNDNKRKFAFRYPDGESMLQVAQRTYNLLDEIKAQYSDKTVMLVCHGGTFRVINTYFEDISNEDFYLWQMGNAELKEYTL